MKDETIAIHTGYTTDPTTKAVTAPIFQTVAYEFDDAQHGADLFNLAVPGNIYSRIMNPTCDVLEQRVSALEQGIGALAVSCIYVGDFRIGPPFFIASSTIPSPLLGITPPVHPGTFFFSPTLRDSLQRSQTHPKCTLPPTHL